MISMQFVSRRLLAALVLAVLTGRQSALGQVPSPQSDALPASIPPRPALTVSLASPATVRSFLPNQFSRAQRSGAADDHKQPEEKYNGGITMHGHWKIEIRNPDGTLAEKREFENSLQPSGGSFLLGLMAGYYSSGDFLIQLLPTAGPGPCVSGAGQQGCVIVRSLTTEPGLDSCSHYFCTTGLTYSAAGTVLPSGSILLSQLPSFTLSGAILANQDGTIGTVSTFFTACASMGAGSPPTTASSFTGNACAATTASSGTVFSQVLSSAQQTYTVKNQQMIVVAVTITFS